MSNFSQGTDASSGACCLLKRLQDISHLYAVSKCEQIIQKVKEDDITHRILRLLIQVIDFNICID